MKTAQLYVVIQEPRQDYRRAYVSLVWFTRADSKAEAVRNFVTACDPGAVREYKTPTAQLVVTGGEPIRV